MLKPALILSLVGTCLAPSAYSSSILSKMGIEQKSIPSINKQVTPINKANPHQSDSSESWTDFSGTWTGSCTSEADEEQTIVIKNDAYSIDLDGFYLSIGNFVSHSTNGSNYSADERYMLNWSADHKVLNLDAAVILFQNSQTKFSFVNLVNTSLSLVDGQLSIEGSIKSLSNEKAAGEDTFSCKLSKRN